jgi:hypothetical protein
MISLKKRYETYSKNTNPKISKNLTLDDFGYHNSILPIGTCYRAFIPAGLVVAG